MASSVMESGPQGNALTSTMPSMRSCSSGDGADELAVHHPGHACPRSRSWRAGRALVVRTRPRKRDHGAHAARAGPTTLPPEAGVVRQVGVRHQQDGQAAVLRSGRATAQARPAAVPARARRRGLRASCARKAALYACFASRAPTPKRAPRLEKCVLHAALFAHLVHQAGRNAHVAAAKRVRHQVGQCLELRAEATSPPHVGQAGNEQGVAAPDQARPRGPGMPSKPGSIRRWTRRRRASGCPCPWDG